MNSKSIIIILIILAVVGISVYALPDKRPVDTQTLTEPSESIPTIPVPSQSVKGSYEVYSPEKIVRAADGKVILFFRASWCPTCRALDANIKANTDSIPEDITILDVNYDDSTVLKQKYGVTYQHTLVQVDAQGNLLKKWTGSPTLSDIVSKTI